MTLFGHRDGVTVTFTNPNAISYDVTAWVEGFAIRRGRTDPLNRYRTGTLQLKLRNDDGRFSPWAAYSPIGQLRPNWKVQVLAGTESVYVGFIDSVTESITGDSYLWVEVACSDGFKLLAMARDEALAAPVGAAEKAGARIARILDAAGWPAGAANRALDTGTPDLDATYLEDNALDEIFEVVDSDPGWFLISRAGKAVFWGDGHTETNWSTARWTFSDQPGTGELPYVRIQPACDDSLVVNRVLVTNRDDETTAVEDTDSIATYGVRAWVRSGLWYDDGLHGADVGQAVLDRSASSIVRVDRIDLCATINDTSGNSADVLWDVFATVELHDRVKVEATAATWQVTFQAYVESITHQVTPHQWRCSLGLGPIISGTQVDNIVAPTSLTVDPACTSARISWRLDGRALYQDIKVEVDPGGLGDGTWLRIPGGLRALTWLGLDPATDYRVSLRVVGNGGFSTTVTADFTTDTCPTPTIDPDDGTITQPPSDGSNPPSPDLSCGAGYTRKIQWVLSVVDLAGVSEIETGLSPDDGTDIKADMDTTFVAGTAYRVCTRIVCQHDSLGTLIVKSDYECRDWLEPATWENSCARATGDDEWETEANDPTRGAASIWLDWCPGPIEDSPVLRDPDTLAITPITAGPGLHGLFQGPDIGDSDAHSLAGYMGGNLGAGVAAYTAIPAAFETTSDDVVIETWVNLADWGTSDLDAVPIVNIGNGVVLVAYRQGPFGSNDFRFFADVTFDTNSVYRTGSTQPFGAGVWLHVTFTWDVTDSGTYTLTVEELGETPVSISQDISAYGGPDYPDDFFAVGGPPFAIIGQTMVWDALAGPTYADEVLADSPIGYWPMHETGGTTFEDLVGTNDMTTSGLVFNEDTSLPVGGAAAWAGTNDNATTSAALALSSTKTITIEMWVTVDSWLAGGTLAALADFQTTKGGMVYFNNTYGQLTLQMGPTGSINRISTVDEPSTATWHHLVVVLFRGGTTQTKVYVDGEALSVTNLFTANPDNTFDNKPLAIGYTPNSSGLVSLAGNVCEVAVYTAELSAERAAAHYAAMGL